MTKRRFFPTLSCLAVAGICLAATAAHSADMPQLPQAIKDKGAIVVGTKCDYPPEGYLDTSDDIHAEDNP